MLEFSLIKDIPKDYKFAISTAGVSIFISNLNFFISLEISNSNIRY